MAPCPRHAVYSYNLRHKPQNYHDTDCIYEAELCGQEPEAKKQQVTVVATTSRKQKVNQPLCNAEGAGYGNQNIHRPENTREKKTKNIKNIKNTMKKT